MKMRVCVWFERGKILRPGTEPTPSWGPSSLFTTILKTPSFNILTQPQKKNSGSHAIDFTNVQMGCLERDKMDQGFPLIGSKPNKVNSLSMLCPGYA